MCYKCNFCMIPIISFNFKRVRVRVISSQIVQSLTNWVERMPFAFSLFVTTVLFVDTCIMYYVLSIHRIGNVFHICVEPI